MQRPERVGNIYGASSIKASFVPPVRRSVDQRHTDHHQNKPTKMSTTKVWTRRPDAEEKARQPPAPAGPIAAPPSDV